MAEKDKRPDIWERFKGTKVRVITHSYDNFGKINGSMAYEGKFMGMDAFVYIDLKGRTVALPFKEIRMIEMLKG